MGYLRQAPSKVNPLYKYSLKPVREHFSELQEVFIAGTSFILSWLAVCLTGGEVGDMSLVIQWHTVILTSSLTLFSVIHLESADPSNQVILFKEQFFKEEKKKLIYISQSPHRYITK